MVAHMKTTINIADPLFQKVRHIAGQENSTFRALVEEGLRWVVEKNKRKGTPFRLGNLKTRGGGLAEKFREGRWEQIRDEIYQDHGA